MMRTPLFNDLLNLRDTVDQIFRENPFGDTFSTLWSRSESSGGAVARPMPFDVYSTDDEVVILAAVPGMRPDDLDLTVQRNTVTISGRVQHDSAEGEDKDVTWHLRELASGSYRRSITLPVSLDADRAEATFEHGMLKIVLPKAEASRPHKIAIRSGSEQQEAIEAGATA